MKRGLLDDMFNVVDVEGKLTGKELQALPPHCIRSL